MLEQSDVAHYLLSLGVVKPSAIVDGELTVVDASRRNSVFIATTPAGPTHVIKQAIPRNAATLEHEAAVLHTLAGAPDVARLVPEVAHHDPGAALLVLRTPGGARDWNAHHAGGRFSPASARLLGRSLAALHRVSPEGVGELPPGVDPMWGLLLPEPPHELLHDLSEAAQDLVARLQASRLCDGLRRLGETGRDGSLVHGDLRWDNCLAVAAPPSRRRTRLLLIDWELAGRGERASDVGTVLAEYLRTWVVSITIVGGSDPARLLSLARHPLRRMRPAVRAFWAAYRAADPGLVPLRRAMELAAVRLVQSAIEQARSHHAVSAHALTLMQLADNTLRQPDEAASTLFGLEE